MCAKKKHARHNIVFRNDSHLPDGVELRTIYALLDWPKLKSNIEVLPVSRYPGYKSADIEMNGLPWEIKNPKGNGKYVVSRNMKTASKQSENIILDMRRMGGSYKEYLPEIKREFTANPRLRRMLIITKAQTIIDMSD